MTRDPITGITVLETTVDYSDHAEDRILEVLEEAVDRSSVSDELAESIADWPTRYHFSRLRSGLIEPLNIKSGMRILDVGCGSGAITRRLGEAGAQVVGLEGSLDRGRAAHVRCEDLESVEIVCGALEAFEDEQGFDLVLIVGVLEYAASFNGEPDPFKAFLNRARSFCRTGGALALAIENQMGLKYLLSWPEDHLGRAWTSLEGYPERPGVRTFSRQGLAELMTECGMPAQRWYFPFPDYKLPSVILSESVFDMGQSTDLVDQLVRSPIRDYANDPILKAQPRSTFREFLNAGLGPDIANSFLVVGGAREIDVTQATDPKGVAWILGGERLKSWMRTQKVTAGSDGLRVIATAKIPVSGTGPKRGWLSHSPQRNEEFRRGRTLEQDILECVHQGDWQDLTFQLKRWLQVLEDNVVEGVTGSAGQFHPFFDPASDRLLPEDWLDVHPSNFVACDDKIHYLDDEWRVIGGVDLILAATRALWYLATELIASGLPLPWPEQTTSDEVCLILAREIGLSYHSGTLQTLRSAEAQFQSLVTGADIDTTKKDLEYLGALSRSSPQIRRSLPYTALNRRIRMLEARLGGNLDKEQHLEIELAETKIQINDMQAELTSAQEEAVRARAEAEKRTLKAEEDAQRKTLEAEEAVRAHIAAEKMILKAEKQTKKKSLEAEEAVKARTDLEKKIREVEKETEREILKVKENAKRKTLEVTGQLKQVRSDFEETQHDLETALQTHQTLQEQLTEAEGENQVWREWRAVFDRRFPIRFYRILQRLLGKS